ncbi:hypothetical protein J7M22_12780 [Candidatus Poribacteria bacterium]|nr:hypothetical protein [Candidatus Poribacteria bacterium]
MRRAIIHLLLFSLPIFCYALEPEIYHWRSFSRLDGLAGNDIRTIFQDDEGRIWIGTSSGLSLFDGIWRSFPSRYDTISNEIHSICEGPLGRLWIGTDRGVAVFDGRSWQNITFGDDPLGNYVLFAVPDQDGVWIGTYRGANHFDGRAWKLWNQKEGYLYTGVRSMLRDSSGQLWFGMEASALYSVLISRFDGRKWTRYTVTDGLPEGPTLKLIEDREGRIWMATPMGVGIFDGMNWSKMTFSDEVVAMDIDPDGRIWVLTRSSLMRYEGGKWIEVLLPQQARKAQSLFIDRSGGIWVGTRENGLFFCDRTVRIHLIPDVRAISSDGSGRIWIGTESGIRSLEGENVISIGQVRSICPEGDSVWVAFKGGLARIDGEGRIIERIEGLPYEDVRVVYRDSAGRMWVGVGLFVSGPGGIANRFSSLILISQSDRKVYPLDATPSSIVEDKSGGIWVGTLGGGLARISGDRWLWFNRKNGLPGDIVTSLMCDDMGRIWAGTTQGVGIFDGMRWKTLSVFTKDLLDNRVQSIVQDNLGRIWVGTREGISVIWDGVSTAFTTVDGLPSNDVTSLFVDKIGRVWVGTSAGLAVYSRETREPQTRITSGPRGVIGTTSAFFEFEGGDADTPSEELLFSWKMDDGPWSQLSPVRFANIPYLQDKMKHTFYVRAYDKNGNFDSTPASVSFYVNAASPVADITDPIRDSVVGGTVSLKGTAYDDDFRDYTLEVDGVPLIRSEKPVRNGLLGEWDTRSSADGEHVLSLKVRDRIEGPFDVEHESEVSIKLTVDNTPPQVKLIHPLPDQKVQGEVEVRFSFDDAHPKSYLVEYRQEKIISPPRLQSSMESAKWRRIASGELKSGEDQISLTWMTSQLYGEISLRVSVTDEAGNIGRREISLFLDNELAKPVVSILSPASGDVISGDVQIIGTAEDPTLTNYVLEYRKASGGDWKVIENVASSGVREGALGVWDTRRVEDGRYQIKLTGYDDNGYFSSISVNLIVDNTPPTLDLASPSDGEVVPGATETRIEGTAWDINFERFTVEYSTDIESGKWLPIALSKSPVRDGILATWNTSGISGKCLLKLTAADKAGLTSQIIREIYIDPSPARVEIRSPQEGDVVSGDVEIKGVVYDENLGSYTLTFSPEQGGEWTLIAEGSESKEGTLGIWKTRGLNGRYLLRLDAQDTAGHKSSTSMEVIVDNTPPTIIMLSPLSGRQVVGDVKVKWRVEDITQVRYVVEFGRGENPETWYKLTDGSVSKPSQMLLAVWNVSGRSGPYALKIRAKDEAGFETVSSVSVIVPEPINGEKGGQVSSTDGQARLILPPRSIRLPSVQIAINPIQMRGRTSYLVEPKGIRFDPTKPAILSILADGSNRNERLIVERWDETAQSWKPIGGSLYRGFISVSITSGGIYGIGQATPPPNEGRRSIEDLTCQPRAIIPGEGIYRKTWISFKMNRDAKVEVKVYDMSGRVQRHLLRGRRLRPGVVTIPWDGRDNGGNLLSSGPYLISVKTEGETLRTGVIIWRR